MTPRLSPPSLRPTCEMILKVPSYCKKKRGQNEWRNAGGEERSILELPCARSRTRTDRRPGTEVPDDEIKGARFTRQGDWAALRDVKKRAGSLIRAKQSSSSSSSSSIRLSGEHAGVQVARERGGERIVARGGSEKEREREGEEGTREPPSPCVIGLRL